MATHLQIDPQGDHEYLVRIDSDNSSTTTAQTLVRVTPDVLRRMSVSAAEEIRVVEETLGWLLAHQQAADLPKLLDLDDVAAAYGGYVDELKRRLSERT